MPASVSSEITSEVQTSKVSIQNVVTDIPSAKRGPDSNGTPAASKKKTIKSVTETTSKKVRVRKELNSIPSQKTLCGKIYLCGTGDCAQLGLTDDVLEYKVPKIHALLTEPVVDICCGGLHTLALTQKGDLYSWGCNDEKALGRDGDEFSPEKITFNENLNIVQLVAGDSFSAVLTSEGEVYAWGTFRTSTGLLGFVGKPNELQATPVKVVFPTKNVRFSHISAGNNHLIALSTTGVVYVVGDNEAGQLGFPERPSRFTSVPRGLSPSILPLKNIVTIAAGGYHSFAINNKGDVYCWGQNNYFQCGIPEKDPAFNFKIETPTKSKLLSNIGYISKIVAGEHHTLILTANKTVFGVGRTDSGQLGINNTVSNLISTSDGKKASDHPERLFLPFDAVKDIVSGSNHCLAYNNTTVASWGYGETLALGHGPEEDEFSPKVIKTIDNMNILNVSAGGHHTVFLVSEDSQS